MIGEHTEKYLNDAVESEYDNCIKKHGEFHNHHEAIAVLAEETEEVVDCFRPFEKALDSELPVLWALIRADNVDETAEECIKNIRDRADEMAKENIQVMAVCDKWLFHINKERGNIE